MHCFMLKTNKKGSDVICLFNNFESVKIRLENVKTYKLAQKRKCRNWHLDYSLFISEAISSFNIHYGNPF